MIEIKRGCGGTGCGSRACVVRVRAMGMWSSAWHCLRDLFFRQ